MWTMPSRFVVMTLLEKLLVYTSVRVVYPLVNYLGDDWGISREEMGYVLAAGEFAAVPAGLIATFGDNLGNRVVAIAAWYVFLAGSLMILAPPSLALIICARVLVSLFGTVFLIVSQSSLVEQTPDSAIGFVTGITEMSWGFAVLALVPILSVAYEHVGWRAMFGILSALIAPFCIETYRNFPKDARVAQAAQTRHEAPADPAAAEGPKPRSAGYLSLAAFRRSAYWRCLVMPGPLLFNMSSLVINVGHNVMFLAFADWAYIYYNVEAEEMGAASFAIGATEMLGDLLVIVFGDRFGLLRMTKVACACFAFCMGMFILAADHSFAAGVALAALLFLPGETLIVSQIAVAERFVPEQLRTTMLGIQFQCHFLGRAIGALIAESLWHRGEVLSTGLLGVSAASCGLGLIFLAQRFLPKDASDARAAQGPETADDNTIPDVEEKGDASFHGPQQQQQTMQDRADVEDASLAVA